MKDANTQRPWVPVSTSGRGKYHAPKAETGGGVTFCGQVVPEGLRPKTLKPALPRSPATPATRCQHCEKALSSRGLSTNVMGPAETELWTCGGFGMNLSFPVHKSPTIEPAKVSERGLAYKEAPGTASRPGTLYPYGYGVDLYDVLQDHLGSRQVAFTVEIVAKVLDVNEEAGVFEEAFDLLREYGSCEVLSVDDVPENDPRRL